MKLESNEKVIYSSPQKSNLRFSVSSLIFRFLRIKGISSNHPRCRIFVHAPDANALFFLVRPNRDAESISTTGNLISPTLRGPEIRRRVVLFRPDGSSHDSMINSRAWRHMTQEDLSRQSTFPSFFPFTV
jgi:hypothetical protein